MKNNRYFVLINLWLLVSLLVSFNTPLKTQANPRTFSNNPPYIISGHVYVYGTSNGLAGAQVKVEFEVCDDPMSVPRTVVLPPTGADGAWEFDERTYELSGGLGCPCPGSPFTITQHLPPSGYLAVAKQTPSNPIPVLGNVIVLNTTGSGVYDNNIFFDRIPYVLTGRVLDDISGTGVPNAEIEIEELWQTITTTTTADGSWEFNEAYDVSSYFSNNGTSLNVSLTVPTGYLAVTATTHISASVSNNTKLVFSQVPPGTYDDNVFHIAEKKISAVTNSEHFSIEWCSDDTDSNYPNNGQLAGFDYIRVLSETLELAWDTYKSMDYIMPPPTYGRTDARITVHVQDDSKPFIYALGNRRPSGLAFAGQIWLLNTLVDLRQNSSHELFHLVQYNYLGYKLNGADLEEWIVLNAPVLLFRDIWLIDSGADWAPQYVVGSSYKPDDFYNNLEYPLSYASYFITNPDDDGRGYGAVVFPAFLDEHSGGPNTVRRMLEEIKTDPNRPFDQIDRALGGKLAETYVKFAIGNYLYDDATYGYRKANSTWPDKIKIILDSLHNHTQIGLGGTDAGSGEVYAMGANYVRITADGLKPSDPQQGNVLNLTLKANNSLLYNSSIKHEDLHAWLLLLNTGNAPKVVDITSAFQFGVWPRWTLNYDIAGLGQQYQEVIVVIVNTAYPIYDPDYPPSLTQPFQTYALLLGQPLVNFDYTLKLTNTDKKPPFVYACIQEESTFGATVKAAAFDADSLLAKIQFGFSAPTILSPTVVWWEDTQFVPQPLLSRWFFIAIDGAGNVATLSAPLQDCDDGGGGGGGGGGGNTCGSADFRPGCDNPDDNVSSAMPSPQSVTLPEGARAEPAVGILQRGYAANAQSLVESVGERAWPVSIDFDPVATAQLFPVLLIPSGGLYGLENDAVFRARLEEYARQGGTIVAFAQQHGYEYAALPGGLPSPAGGGAGGGGLSGYGWNEDISCFKAALRMETWHPILTAACSPGVTYDLSWTQPGRCRIVLIIVVYFSPPATFPTA